MQLFTIGHSNRKLDAFLALLVENGVAVVADVRSSPYSRFSPHFNKESLKRALREIAVEYVFLGEELGARRSEETCYAGDVARYDLIAKSNLFQAGLARLRRGAARNRIALMCAEKDPLACHRTILICRHLRKEAEILHILGPGEIETREQAETRLLKLVGVEEQDLFRSRPELIEEAYDLRGAEIAFRRKGK